MENQETNRRQDCLDEIKYIGLKIAFFRKMRNMTQAELADKVFINKKYLSHIESGSSDKVISLPLLINISKALDVELPLFVDFNDLNKTKNEVVQELNAMKEIFKEMKDLNKELDEMINETEDFKDVAEK